MLHGTEGPRFLFLLSELFYFLSFFFWIASHRDDAHFYVKEKFLWRNFEFVVN